MKRITRDRCLTPEEADKYDGIRRKIVAELPDLIARHHAHTESLATVDEHAAADNRCDRDWRTGDGCACAPCRMARHRGYTPPIFANEAD